MNTEMRQCEECKEWKPISFFHERGKYKASCDEFVARRSLICNKCAFKNRNTPEKKLEAKAENTISNHARKLKTTTAQLHAWGITREYVMYLFKRELELIENGMEWCANCFDEDPDPEDKPCYTKATPLGSLHLDIIDMQRFKREGKLTRSNIRAICDTANKAKSRNDPTKHDINTANYLNDKHALAKGIQNKLTEPPRLQPSLF